MCSFRMGGLIALVPVAVLLTISFFVLLVLRKLDSDGLKAFGYAVVALLWVCAALIFGIGVYTMVSGRHPMMDMMQGGLKGAMGQNPMMQQQMMNK
jgi:hypothetical protein